VANLKYQFDSNQKDKNHIISIARLVENKQIKHQIEAGILITGILFSIYCEISWHCFSVDTTIAL
jgi:hypothetical protein